MVKKENYIYYKGEKLMLNEWATPKQLAQELGYAEEKDDCTQRISNWIRRKKVDVRRIEELGLTLVDRSTIPASA